MKKLLAFLMVFGLPCLVLGADTATPTKTPTATHTPTWTGTPTIAAVLNDGAAGKGKLMITKDKWNFDHFWPSDLNGVPQVYSVPLTPTPTQTPTITPTCNLALTPMCANQYTPTPTPYLARAFPTMLIGSPTPIVLSTPVAGKYTDMVVPAGAFNNGSASPVTIQFFNNWLSISCAKVLPPVGGYYPSAPVTFYDLDKTASWQYLPLSGTATISGSILFFPHATPLPMTQ